MSIPRDILAAVIGHNRFQPDDYRLEFVAKVISFLPEDCEVDEHVNGVYKNPEEHDRYSRYTAALAHKLHQWATEEHDGRADKMLAKDIAACTMRWYRDNRYQGGAERLRRFRGASG